MFPIDAGLKCFHTIGILRRIVNQQCILQCRSYQPRKLDKRQYDRVSRHTKPFIPSPKHPFTKEWQTHPNIRKDYERVAWAKFGSSSGVNISNLLPTKAEIQEEWDAEKRWWPSLQEMKDENLKAAKLKEKEKADYERKVAENMAKMPKWIEQWKKDQQKQLELEVSRVAKKDAMTEKALEDFNYIHASDSAEIKEYVAELREKERKEKRIIKKLAKTKPKS